MKMKNKIKLKKACLKDSKFVYKLRYTPEVRKISSHHNKIPFKKFEKKFKESYKEYQIIGNNKGYLRKDKQGYISICLIKTCRNKGYGQKLLRKLKGRAIILSNNPRSLHTFLKAKWKIKGFYLEK